MLAIVVEQGEKGPLAVLRENPVPYQGPHELLVEVHAASVNRSDLLQKKGHYPSKTGASPVLGLDFSGTVVSTGSTKYHLGDHVMALVDGGAQAEFAVVHEDLAMPIPEGLSFEEAAAIPEVFLTAFQALRWLGQLKKGQTVLIHSGASGLGTAAIQLAKSLETTVFATAGTEEKVQACLNLGAKKAIDYRSTPHFASPLLKWTDGRGVDLIIDTVGASFWQENIQALAQEGKIICIAYLSGAHIADFDLSLLQKKWGSLIGSRLRDRSLAYKIALTREFSAFALPLFASRTLRPVVHSILPLESAEQAHTLLHTNQTIGKVVLKVR